MAADFRASTCTISGVLHVDIGRGYHAHTLATACMHHIHNNRRSKVGLGTRPGYSLGKVGLGVRPGFSLDKVGLGGKTRQ